ncbi:MAG TPA: VWA domain-containing protein [Pyrinomonadaceae bacterium]|nr:VWA domain-containing protein [Pyrinomonadaceae bacterium]
MSSYILPDRPRLFAAVMAALLLCGAALAQSGRVRPEGEPAPVQTPTPTPTPAPETDTEEDGVERIDTDIANVLLTAVDKKRNFVTTLRQEDVRVLEDGVAQQVTSFQRETDLPLSVVLLVDTSASQSGVMSDEREAALAFVESALRPGKDAASVLSFTGITRIEQGPTGDLARLRAAIATLKTEFQFGAPECEHDSPPEVGIRCETRAWDALLVATRGVLARTPQTTRRAVILLSDGDDSYSRVSRYRAAEEAVRENVVVYSIGIRDKEIGQGELRRDRLRQVSEDTGGRAFFPKNRAQLDAAFAQIAAELRSQYLITYTPTNRAKDGGLRRVAVEIVNPDLRKQNVRLLYRQGYYAKRVVSSQ